MNARLKKSFGFYSGMFYQGKFMVNHWNVQLDLLTVSESADQQNIAYERMKYWMHHVIDDSILIAHDDPALATVSDLNARILVLPDEPVDQIIGIMLYLKLNAIMENRMIVVGTEIWSTQGDQTSYIHIGGENLGPNLGQDGWWSDSRPVFSVARNQTTGKVVTLDRGAEWKDVGLAWESRDGERSDTVVFAKFPKDEDK